MSEPDVTVYADAGTLASATAARLVTALADAQSARGTASVVLTGGGTGIALLAEVLRTPAHTAVDWAGVDFFWGDERFVPAEDEQRNELQARRALLDHLPVSAERVHAMPPAGGVFADVHDAAAGYATGLAIYAAAAGEIAVPCFDVCLLGVGEEGHVASLFPGSPGIRPMDTPEVRAVIGVADSPKPPAGRVSLTLPAIRRAREVWLVTAGATKADAIANALHGAPEHEVPAAGARGIERTRYLIDAAAAGR